jgi:hypothetical protein
VRYARPTLGVLRPSSRLGFAATGHSANVIGIRHVQIRHRVLQKIIIALAKFASHRNPFDCASPRAVRSSRWASGSVGMLEALTALFGVMSVGIFIAHAVDGYRSRA